MRVFVTGANGFIGKAFCHAAISRGHEVLGLVRCHNAALPAGCQRITGSLEEMPWTEIERFRPDTLLHLAWTTTPGINFHSPLNKTLVRLSDSLFKNLAKIGASHLAGTGTFIEYASSKTPLIEEVSPLSPLYPYSQAKAITLENLSKLETAKDATWSWFRIFNAFGEGEDKARMISSIMVVLATGQTATVRTPDSVRDYIHVSDVALGMLYSLEQRQTGAVNIGCGKGISVLELAREIADTVGAPLSLVHGLNPPGADLMPVAIADNSKLRTTGWSPQLTLPEGLHRLWNTLKIAPSRL